jgi:PadR family transcriptional regulator PadR
MAERNLELMRGTLDVMILKAVSWGPAHGYGVASWIEGVTGEELKIEEGSLYPALHRLEHKGWVRSEWGLSENKRHAKYYVLTEEGREALMSESSAFERITAAVGSVLRAVEGPRVITSV